MRLSKLEDFEDHRQTLFKYACALLRTRSYINRHGELSNTAKDIVQNCYIQFHHSFNKDSFVNDGHLSSFLRTILYRCYQAEINVKQRNAQYSIFKVGEFKHLDITKHPINKCNLTIEQFDIIAKFRYKLNTKQSSVLDLLLEGYNKIEISKKLSIPISSINGPRGIMDQIRSVYSRLV